MRRLAMFLLLWATLAVQIHPAYAQTDGWRDTPFVLPGAGPEDRFGSLNHTCWDPINPGQVLVAEHGVGIARYDLRSGSRELILPNGRFNADGCSETGWLFWNNIEGASAIAGSSPTQIEPRIMTLARDGSDRFYGYRDGWLYVGWAGAMRARHPTPFAGAVVHLWVSGPDGQALYAAAVRRPAEQTVIASARYEIWFSPTGGNTDPQNGGAPWELRSSTEMTGWFGGPYVNFMPLGEAHAPVDTLLLRVDPGYPGSSNRVRTLLSVDGGRTFATVYEGGLGSVNYSTFYAVRDGILNFSVSAIPVEPRSFSLSLTDDGGKTWRALGKPALPTPPESGRFQLVVARAAPQVIAFGDASGVYLSVDGGQNWTRIGDERGMLQFSPYLPLQLLGRNGPRLSVFDVPLSGQEMTVARPALDQRGYAPETGHTISPLFFEYWRRNGGLARFGYPRTDAFREVNAADGRAYLTQYFERARFEYHPEHSDPRHQVLLGLLGSELTAERRSEAAFQPRLASGAPGERFFPETGHAIHPLFLAFWERNGGLAAFGYPISEAFEEINPEDGRPYLVQYFERNRFEYHPEHIGTEHEVMLGLLGNDLLRKRGWIEIEIDGQ